ncbi:outer membrane protein TolC [Bradyrhizobium sp. CIR48]|nr:outer membrane protein TolC [Bradyrhizobium sp. CIR18]MBB4429283.1 outer membrane protein TolC [Bradyrhizobium sp. CIR48]
MGIERMYPPKYWQMRAEEFRAKADNAEYRQTKDALSKVADNYDELAQRAGRIRTVQDAAE